MRKSDAFPRKPGAWRPLLSGAAADRALESVLRIASAVEARLASHDPLGARLADGTAGMALLFEYLDRALPGGRHRAAAERFSAAAISGVAAAEEMKAGLFAGFTGVAWVLEHLERGGARGDDDDVNAEIDSLLAAFLDRPSSPPEFDLIFGLAGIAVYLLERLPRPTAAASLEVIVDELVLRAHRRPDGTAWWTPPELLGVSGRRRAASGWYDVGMAHGTPGVLAALARVHDAGIAAAKIEPVLRDAARWILAQRLCDAGVTLFPAHVASAVPPRETRCAWCYGDPGVAVALLQAGWALGDRMLSSEALHIARRAALQRGDLTHIRDASLCHGAAGVGHLYNRLFQATRDGAFEAAAAYWLGRALELERPGEGVGGFQVWMADDAGISAWRDRPDFLLGATGIALSLLAAVSDAEPLWDRALLAALPPCAAAE